MQTDRPSKTFLQIMFMCLGFFGIQFGWALQMGNMSAIYSRLGASEDQIPLLWLAAPGAAWADAAPISWAGQFFP